MTTDEGVLDADQKLRDVLAKLLTVCTGFASSKAAEAIAEETFRDPRLEGVITGMALAIPDDPEMLDTMVHVFKTGMQIGIQAVGKGLVETITEMAK